MPSRPVHFSLSIVFVAGENDVLPPYVHPLLHVDDVIQLDGIRDLV